jgi:cell division protease FtsH
MWLWFAAVLAINFVVARLLLPGPEAPLLIPYTLFKDEVARRNVQAIYSRGDTLTGRFAAPVTYPPAPAQAGAAKAEVPKSALPKGAPERAPPRTSVNFVTTLPAFVGPGLEQLLVDNGVEISAEPINEVANPWSTLIFGFGPALLIIAFYVWMFRRAGAGGGLGGGILGIGKSRARRYDQDNETKVTFKDVAGIDEAKNELVEIVDFLRDPPKYTRLGGAAPKGVLLIGAPGTGKTLLARAVAGEAGVPFFSMSAAEFVEMIVGVGRRARARPVQAGARERARDHLHRRARRDRPCARSHVDRRVERAGADAQPDPHRDGRLFQPRGHHRARRHQPARRARQGADATGPVRPARRGEPARPHGPRGDPQVHTRNVPLGEDVRLGELAAATPGFSGAELRNLVNEAALLAARRARDNVQQQDFLDALEKIVLGPARPILLSRDDRERIAYHEGGHAILGLVVPGADPVHRVTIVPRGQALGVTYQRPDADRYKLSGGISARAHRRHARWPGRRGDRLRNEDDRRRERHRAGDRSGAPHGHALGNERSHRHDPAGAARQPVPHRTGRLRQQQARSARKPRAPSTRKFVRIIDESHVEAKRLLVEHRARLDALARALLEHETLNEDEILDVTGLRRAPPPASAAPAGLADTRP